LTLGKFHVYLYFMNNRLKDLESLLLKSMDISTIKQQKDLPFESLNEIRILIAENKINIILTPRSIRRISPACFCNGISYVSRCILSLMPLVMILAPIPLAVYVDNYYYLFGILTGLLGLVSSSPIKDRLTILIGFDPFSVFMVCGFLITFIYSIYTQNLVVGFISGIYVINFILGKMIYILNQNMILKGVLKSEILFIAFFIDGHLAIRDNRLNKTYFRDPKTSRLF